MRHRPPFPPVSTLLSALLCGVALAGPAAAQSWSDPGVGVGAHAAFTKGRDADSGGLSGGVHLRARLTGGIGLEALVTYRTQEYASGGAPVLWVEEVPVQGSALLFPFSRTRFQPYLLGGIGYYWVRTTGEGANADAGRHTENKFGFHAGAGLEMRLSPRLTFQGDVRYVFVDVDAVTALESAYPPARSAEFWHATAGLSYSF